MLVMSVNTPDDVERRTVEQNKDVIILVVLTS